MVDVSEGEWLAEILVMLAKRNVRPDIQEYLVQGNPRDGVAPGALLAVMQAAYRQGIEDSQKPCKNCGFMPEIAGQSAATTAPDPDHNVR